MKKLVLGILLAFLFAYAAFSTIPALNEELPVPLTFNSNLDSGFYENDDEICLVCYGVDLRCGDEITREDLLAMVKFGIDGEEWTICKEEAKTMSGTWQSFGPPFQIPFVKETP